MRGTGERQERLRDDKYCKLVREEKERDMEPTYVVCLKGKRRRKRRGRRKSDGSVVTWKKRQQKELVCDEDACFFSISSLRQILKSFISSPNTSVTPTTDEKALLWITAWVGRGAQ